jgi:hypothetical protein
MSRARFATTGVGDDVGAAGAEQATTRSAGRTEGSDLTRAS